MAPTSIKCSSISWLAANGVTTMGDYCNDNHVESCWVEVVHKDALGARIIDESNAGAISSITVNAASILTGNTDDKLVHSALKVKDTCRMSH